jgi:UDP-glucose 4-epimerase
LKILVTGGAGFIGSAIVTSLLREGHEVGVLDNVGEARRKFLITPGEAPEFHKADVRDLHNITKIMKDYDGVMHEAALVDVARSVKDPISTNETNVGGTLNLLRACLDTGVKLFVNASSSAVYGESNELPISEKTLTRPISPYGVSKLAAENYCTSFARLYGLHTISLRYFNVYGPGQGIGPYSGVIPRFVAAIISGKPPVIFGDGAQTRDFVFVEDVVKANLLCLRNDFKPGLSLNIATGVPTSISELANLLIEILHAKGMSPVHDSSREGEIVQSYADISLAKSVLGFSPSFSISQGLPRVANSIKEAIVRT